ncbi:hypothetical protein NIES267_57420 [Calothrix parasitica NIES-267]|uniref:Uncharacterized protein n=1 Tax=Calothrix parasitica NIES-267 TaxID=1973488 RepID=A0A1Z4LYB4_9CYAN|nr:hypothetical protein NIES267_57420 [Calothrix parasitica NIES-267]
MTINSSFDKYLFFRTLDNNVIAVSSSDSLNIESEDGNNSTHGTGENHLFGASLNAPGDNNFVVVTMLEDGSRTILYNNGDTSSPGTWELYGFR